MNVLQRSIARMAEADMHSHASLLKWTTIIIWACSLVAEVGTFANNKKLPPEEKSFIIKQELTAGGLSLALMYLMADRLEKAGEWLVRQGKLLPNDLPAALRTPDKIQKILQKDVELLRTELKNHPDLPHKLLTYQKGLATILGTLGTIIAFNITTPLISNQIVSYFQKRYPGNKGTKGKEPLSAIAEPIHRDTLDPFASINQGLYKPQTMNNKPLSQQSMLPLATTPSNLPYCAYPSKLPNGSPLLQNSHPIAFTPREIDSSKYSQFPPSTLPMNMGSNFPLYFSSGRISLK